MTLKQRREKAFELFLKGYSDAEVAQRIKVTRQTASNYRRKYEQSVHAEARNNPALLREVLANTMRSLQELERVRSEAWRSMEDRLVEHEFSCAECGAENIVSFTEPLSDQARTQYLNVLLKAQDQRAKLFGVIGVKADMLVAVAQVKIAQEKLIEWMAHNLEGATREALANFLENELSQFLDAGAGPMAALDVVDAQVISDSEDAAA